MGFPIKITRRTFEAAKHPKGSKEREQLNCDPLTSEYMPSYRYALQGWKGAAVKTFRTKAEAEAEAVRWGCNS